MTKPNVNASITRRGLIRGLGALGATSVLAACSQQEEEVPQTTEQPAGEEAAPVATDLTLMRETYVTWVDGAVGVMPLPLDEGVVDVSSLTYKSSDESIAKIGKNGAVIGVAKGEANVTVSTADGNEFEAKVIVYPTRTDCELVNDFYEYARAQEIKRLEGEGVTVTEGVDFVGTNCADAKTDAQVLAFADELVAAVETNGGKSPYESGSPRNTIASLATVYREDAATQMEKLTKDLADFLKPVNEAKTAEEIMAFNAQVAANGNWGLWRNDVASRQVNDGADPGLNVVLSLRLTPYFVLEKQSVYESEEAAKDLTTLVEGVLAACGETEAEYTANAPKVIEGLKLYSPEKTRNDVMSEGLSEDEMNTEMERLGISGGLYSADELDEMVPNLQFKKALESFDIKDTKIMVSGIGVLTRFNDYVASCDVDALRELIKFCVAYPYYSETEQGHAVCSTFLALKSSLATFMDYSTVIPSADADPDYATFVTHRLRNTYGWEMGYAYAEGKLRGQQVEEDLKAMIEQFIAEYRSSFERVDWISDTTREGYLQKMDKLEYNLFVPDDSTGYVTGEDLSCAADGGSIFSNVRKLYSGRWRSKATWMGKTFTGADCYWFSSYGMTTPYGEFSPMMVNASYSPQCNAIGIFVGFVNEEFYRPGEAMFNYGRIGTAIAHEIGHGMDLRGAGYDATGVMKSILTDEDAQKLQAKQDKVVREFSTYSVVYKPEDESVVYANGEFEAAEIMADLGGDEITLEVVKKEFPGDDNLRAFFENLALLWNTEHYDEMTLQSDYHPYGKLRGGVTPQMFDEFYDVFDIQEGDGMYLAPEYRERLWS